MKFKREIKEEILLKLLKEVEEDIRIVKNKNTSLDHKNRMVLKEHSKILQNMLMVFKKNRGHSIKLIKINQTTSNFKYKNKIKKIIKTLLKV